MARHTFSWARRSDRAGRLRRSDDPALARCVDELSVIADRAASLLGEDVTSARTRPRLR